MPVEGRRQVVRGLLAVGLRRRQLHVLAQRFLEVRVGAVLDDRLGALARGQATQVRESLLGDDDVHVVFGVVDVAVDRKRDRKAHV